MSTPFEQLQGIIAGRRSIRRFAPEQVPDELIQRLFEAARWAPSPGNRQAFRFWFSTSAALRQRLVDMVSDEVARLRQGLRAEAKTDGEAYLANFTHFDQAPAIIFAIYRSGTDLLSASSDPGTGVMDRGGLDALAACSAAIQNLLLAAHSLNLGACWMTGPLLAAPRLAEALGVPNGWELAALIPLGFPAEKPEAPSRRTVARLTRRLD